jgi:hypothetical protein
MTTTHTDWQEAPAAEAWALLTVASAGPQPRHSSRVRWPVLLGWGGVLLGGGGAVEARRPGTEMAHRLVVRRAGSAEEAYRGGKRFCTDFTVS